MKLKKIEGKKRNKNIIVKWGENFLPKLAMLFLNTVFIFMVVNFLMVWGCESSLVLDRDLLYLNFLPIFFIVIFLYLVFNRFDLSFLFSSIFIIGLSVLNVLKVYEFNSPLYLDDFKNLSLFLRSLYLVKKLEIALGLLAALILIFVLFLNRFYKFKVEAWKKRLILLLVLSLSMGIYLDRNYRFEVLELETKNYSIEDLKKNGFIKEFIEDIYITVNRDKNKSLENGRKILAGYEYKDLQEDFDIITIYISGDRGKELKVFDSLQGKSIEGKLVLDYGDRHKNQLEYFTGNNQFYNYNTRRDSHVWYFKENGYRTEYLSLGDDISSKINENIGFDFTRSVKKYTLVEEVSKNIASSSRYFGVIDLGLEKKEDILKVDGELEKVVDFLKASERKSILVLIEEGSGEEQEGQYNIWGNQGIKFGYNKSFIKKDRIASLNFILPKLLRYMDLRGDQYIQYINEVNRDIDVIGSEFFYVKGKKFELENLPDYIRKIYLDLRDVEYYKIEGIKK